MNWRLIGMLAGSLAIAYSQPPVVTPSTPPTVTQGTTRQFTANKAVTWSLSPGSAGSIDSSTGVYTAPSSVQVKHKAGPCQMFPPDHIYGTRIDALPVHPYSTSIIAINAGDFRVGFEPSFWTNVTTSSSPTYDGNFIYTPLNNGTFRVLEWPLLKAETGVFMPPFNGTDNHEVYVNRETCEFTDIYNRYPAGTNVIQECPLCTGQSGVRYFGTFDLPTTGATDAAGMAQQPVSLSLADIQSGEIRHALRFSMANGYIKPSHIWPATANAYPYCSGTACYEYGMYVRLKASYDISSFSPTAQIILTALKRYGMVMTDGGTSYAVQTNANVTQDYDVRQALNEIFFGALRSTNFEVVNTSALKITDASGAVALSNGYVTPSQYAEVVATDGASNVTKVRVALRGVTVGVPEPTMTIWSGHTVTLASWVTGATDTSVTWSMSPSTGTLNGSTGQYTAPNDLTAPGKVRFTATSNADSSATAIVDAVLWPADDGVLRLNLGHTGEDFVDGNGKKWWRDDWAQIEGFGSIWSDGPANSIYAEGRYYYNDGRLKWYLPNGNYKARIYLSINDGSADVPIKPEEYVCHVDAQGQIVRHDFSAGRVTGWARRTGGYLDVPIKVTDGSAYLSMRYRGPNSVVNHYCSWSAISIAPDATTAYLEIESGNQLGDIIFNRTRQFYAFGWYMSNSVTWSITSGPGSINSTTGLYSSPGTPPLTDTPVVIRATSTVDGTKYAETTINFVFGTIIINPVRHNVIYRSLSNQFSATINGLPYASLTWSIDSGPGSITSGGLYTAPSSIGVSSDVVIRATSTDETGHYATYTMSARDVLLPTRINSGGLTPFTDGDGNVWDEDYGFGTGSVIYSGDNAPISGSPAGMLPLYRTSRYAYIGESFSYRFAVPNGRYDVTLKWAEYRSSSQGMLMDVVIEGNTVLTNFDPVTAAGGVRIAYDRTFTTTVLDNELRIDFNGSLAAGYVGAGINGILLTAVPSVSTPKRRITVIQR